MQTVTLPLNLVLCTGSFLIGMLVTLAFLARGDQTEPTPTYIMMSEHAQGDGPGCGLVLFIVAVIVAILTLAILMGG